MWPQSSLEEVQKAQVLADAGDADYTWQVEPQLAGDEWGAYLVDHGSEVVDRFLREVLGWDQYGFHSIQGDDGFAPGFFGGARGEGLGRGGSYLGIVYLRCRPGEANSLYPNESSWQHGTEPCAPTIDDLHFETVSLDLAQLDRRGSRGVWVVSDWRMTTPFAQADPAVVEAEATRHLEQFLAARIAGQDAEGYVEVDPDVALDVQLLYATSTGAPYERYEIERVSDPDWPYSGMDFKVRLYANGGTTVVEQEISWSGGLSMDANTTTENGQPFVLSYTSSDGEVSVSAPGSWQMWWPDAAHVADVGVWFGGLWGSEDFFGSGERIEFVDPVAYDAWCAANGGSPLLSAPADAAAIAQEVISDPNFETTAPVAASVGGVEAVSIDVALAPGGEACGIGMIEISRWIHTIGWNPGWRLRLYLVDLPEGMSVQTLAITVVAPGERFDEVIAETTPIIESIAFNSD